LSVSDILAADGEIFWRDAFDALEEAIEIGEVSDLRGAGGVLDQLAAP
jgi:hypothetical protein